MLKWWYHRTLWSLQRIHISQSPKQLAIWVGTTQPASQPQVAEPTTAYRLACNILAMQLP